MSSIKFYALVCRNMNAVKRHQDTIPKEDLVIVINSINPEFVTEAEAYCTAEGIEHYITQSNGGPSMGKNSVLDLFEASDHDYMVLIDGDDFITHHGYWTYKKLAESPEAPDVVALTYQYGIQRESGYNTAVALLNNPTQRSALLGVADPLNSNAIHGGGTRCFLQDSQWWKRAKEGKIVVTNEASPHSFELCDIHKRWANLCYKYISNWETHLRLVWFSKTAVAGNRFDLNFHIGEDTLFYLQLKKQALDGNFVMKHLFDLYATYVYDTRIGGLVWKEKDSYGQDGTEDYGWYLWLKKLVEEYERYEELGIMSEEQLPEVTVKTHYTYEQVPDPTWYEGKTYTWDIEWPEDYRPNTNGLINYPAKKHIIFA